MISRVDVQLGRVLRAVDEAGAVDATDVFIFTDACDVIPWHHTPFSWVAVCSIGASARSAFVVRARPVRERDRSMAQSPHGAYSEIRSGYRVDYGVGLAFCRSRFVIE